MTELIVDLFERVHVDVRDCYREFGAGGAQELFISLEVKLAAVGNTCHVIGMGEQAFMMQGAFELLQQLNDDDENEQSEGCVPVADDLLAECLSRRKVGDDPDCHADNGYKKTAVPSDIPGRNGAWYQVEKREGDLKA